MTLSNSIYFSDLPKSIRIKINDLFFDNNESKEIDNDWMIGKLSYQEILKYLSEEIPYSFKTLEASLISSAENFILNQNISNSLIELKKQRTKTACVTINTDIFNKITSKKLKLDNYFDFIINSNDYNTSNKNELCKIALDKFENKINIKNSILIDDKLRNIENYKKIGGQGYHYKNDSAYYQWYLEYKSKITTPN